MTSYRHTLQIILMKTSCREKVDLPPQSSLLCSHHKIRLWIDYINVLRVSLYGLRLLEAMWSSEALRRTAALLPRGRTTSPLHDALIYSSPSFLFSRKRSLNPKDVTVLGWPVLIPSQRVLEHTTMSKKLSTPLLHWGDPGINRTSFLPPYRCGAGLPFSARETTLIIGA